MDQPVIDTRALFAPKKGKQGTKGQKQIYDENKKTIKNHLIMAIVPIVAKILFSISSTSSLDIILLISSFIIQSVAIYGMYYMAKPVVSSSNAVVDGGIDLNLKSGFADYLKDLIITTAICTGLSFISNGFWLLWLWLPCYYVYKFWVSVIAPWIFQQPPEEAPEVADKKRKKMERKMARGGGYR